jgi:Na+-transporting methylmalonyl-CoA/oxaloacetate decarboxylase gamma subunit
MRMVFSMLSLLIAVAVIGILVKKQLGGVSAAAAPAASASPPGMPAMTGTPQQQVQQFRQAAESAVQQARPMPDDK